MGRRSASLLRGHHQPVSQQELDALHTAAATQDEQPFSWTISLTVTLAVAYLRWRSLRVAPMSTFHNIETTTDQVFFAARRLGMDPVLLHKGKAQDEAPAPLTPDELEARDNVDFFFDQKRQECEWADAYDREWIQRLRKLGLVQCGIPGLPTYPYDGQPCICRTCRTPTNKTSRGL